MKKNVSNITKTCPSDYWSDDFQLCPELQEIADLVEIEKNQQIIENLKRFIVIQYIRSLPNTNEQERISKDRKKE